MTCVSVARTGPVPAHGHGQIGLGRGERETRGEHRGRGERLPSGSRFVFPVAPILVALLACLPAPARAQDAEDESSFTLALRVGGLVSTRLIGDDLGGSFFADTLLDDRFQRDSIEVRMGVAPDLTLVAGYTMNESLELQLSAGMTLGRLQVHQSGLSRDAGSVGVGHALVSVRKPVRGFIGRGGAGVLWFEGGDMTSIREMRGLNPLIELGVSRRWQMHGLELEAGLVAQGTQISSTAVEAPGLVYRAGLDLAIARRFGR